MFSCFFNHRVINHCSSNQQKSSCINLAYWILWRHKLRKQHICKKAELHTVLQPPPVIQTHLVVGSAASIVSSLCVEASDVRCELPAFHKQLKGWLTVKPTRSSLDIPPLIKTLLLRAG